PTATAKPGSGGITAAYGPIVAPEIGRPRPPSTAKEELTNEKEITVANVPNNSRLFCLFVSIATFVVVELTYVESLSITASRSSGTPSQSARPLCDPGIHGL